MRCCEWRARYGRLPSSYDWSRTHAHRRGGEPLERLSAGEWPSASAVSGVYGSWKAARTAAANQIVQADDDRQLIGASFLTTGGSPGREVLAIANERARPCRSGSADRDSGPETLYTRRQVLSRGD